jgi:hypothetical protein
MLYGLYLCSASELPAANTKKAEYVDREDTSNAGKHTIKHSERFEDG